MALFNLCSLADSLLSDMVEHTEDRVSHDEGQISLVVRKPVFGVSNQVSHKSVCPATEDGLKLEISDLESRGIVVSV